MSVATRSTPRTMRPRRQINPGKLFTSWFLLLSQKLIVEGLYPWPKDKTTACVAVKISLLYVRSQRSFETRMSGNQQRAGQTFAGLVIMLALLLLWARKYRPLNGLAGTELNIFRGNRPHFHTLIYCLFFFFLAVPLQWLCNHVNFLPLSFGPNEHIACPIMVGAFPSLYFI